MVGLVDGMEVPVRLGLVDGDHMLARARHGQVDRGLAGGAHLVARQAHGQVGPLTAQRLHLGRLGYVQRYTQNKKRPGLTCLQTGCTASTTATSVVTSVSTNTAGSTVTVTSTGECYHATVLAVTE